MSYQIDNQEIGTYISGLIEQEFESARQFCKAYYKRREIILGEHVRKFPDNAKDIYL